MSPALSSSANQDGHSAAHRVVKVLLISQFDEDHQALESILQHSKWERHGVRSQQEALALLEEQPIPVVICESDLPDGSWQELHARFYSMKVAPLLVVASRLADDRLWSEVLNLGAYNVLAKPLDTKEVFHVVSLAWLLWKNRFENQERYALNAA